MTPRPPQSPRRSGAASPESAAVGGGLAAAREYRAHGSAQQGDGLTNSAVSALPEDERIALLREVRSGSISVDEAVAKGRERADSLPGSPLLDGAARRWVAAAPGRRPAPAADPVEQPAAHHAAPAAVSRLVPGSAHPPGISHEPVADNARAG